MFKNLTGGNSLFLSENVIKRCTFQKGKMLWYYWFLWKMCLLNLLSMVYFITQLLFAFIESKNISKKFFFSAKFSERVKKYLYNSLHISLSPAFTNAEIITTLQNWKVKILLKLFAFHNNLTILNTSMYKNTFAAFQIQVIFDLNSQWIRGV